MSYPTSWQSARFGGCWVEQMDNGKWAICNPDCSYMETGFGSKGAASRALNYYRKEKEAAA